MFESLRAQIEEMAYTGMTKDRANAEREVRLTQGQTPTIDTSVYDPKEMRDNGYPLVEPTVTPNRHTKEGKLLFANGDPATDNPIGRLTELPSAEEMLPTTQEYIRRTDELFGSLSESKTTEDSEMGLQEVMFQYRMYERFTDNQAEYNRIAWTTAERLERAGFSFIKSSDFDEEGIDDNGLIGLQYVMGSMIMRGAKTPEEAIRNIGETGANEEQLRAAWDSANRAAHRNEQGLIDPIAVTNQQAMQDPRYRGAVETMLRADGISEDIISGMSNEEILSKGKMYADMTKSNFAAMGAIIASAATKEDLPVGDSIMYLLDVDEAMPLETADFGRNILGLASDPTSYMGGAGLLARMTGKLAGKNLTRQMITRALGSAKFGATFGAGYGGLYDIGMQTIERQGGKREDYDISQMGQATAIGGALGYVLGGVTSLAPEAIRATSTWFKKFQERNANTVAELSAADEFRNIPVPDNMVDATDTFANKALVDELARNKVKSDVLIAQVNEEIPDDINGWIYDLLIEKPGASSEDIMSTFKSTVNAMLDEPDVFNVSPLDMMKLESIKDMMSRIPNEFLDTINFYRKDQLSIIEGGATEIDPDHVAPIELADTTSADELAAFRKEVGHEINDRTNAKIELTRQHADDFRFDSGDTVISKQSGKEFEINHRRWDEKTGEAQYFVTGSDGESHYMSEWGMVGGKPKLSVISNEYSVSLPQVEREMIARAIPDNELRNVANKLKSAEDVQQLYYDRIELPTFDYSTSVNKREGMTTPERNFWSGIFSNKQDVIELLEEVPTVSFHNGQLNIKKKDMFALDEYLERLVQLHDGPVSELPLTIRNGTFIDKRLIEFKD